MRCLGMSTRPQRGEDLHVPCPPHTTERALVTKIDLHVIPYLCVMYLLAFLDRVNISNANVFGLTEELHLESGNKFNTDLVYLFRLYIYIVVLTGLRLSFLSPMFCLRFLRM